MTAPYEPTSPFIADDEVAHERSVPELDPELAEDEEDEPNPPPSGVKGEVGELRSELMLEMLDECPCPCGRYEVCVGVVCRLSLALEVELGVRELC